MKYFLIFISFVLCYSCKMEATSKKKESWYKFIDSKYQQDKNKFKSNFIDHFPTNLFDIEDLKYTLIGDSPGLENVCFKICVEYNGGEIDSLYKLFTTSCKVMYSFNDTSLLVLDKYLTKDNVGFKKRLTSKEKEDLSKASDLGRLPIPNFKEYTLKHGEKRSVYNLPSDFMICVIDAGKGKYWEDNKLMKNAMMPDAWVHGFSKGVAVSMYRKEVIYWFEIW